MENTVKVHKSPRAYNGQEMEIIDLEPPAGRHTHVAMDKNGDLHIIYYDQISHRYVISYHEKDFIRSR